MFGDLFYVKLILVFNATAVFDGTVCGRTNEYVLCGIVSGDSTRFVTYCQFVFVRSFHHRFFQETCHTMRNHCVPFHFSNTQTTVVCPSTYGLSCNIGHRSGRTMIDFVFYHVFQSHVISRSNKDSCFQLFSSHSIVQYFVSI